MNKACISLQPLGTAFFYKGKKWITLGFAKTPKHTGIKSNISLVAGLQGNLKSSWNFHLDTVLPISETDYLPRKK